MTNRLLHVSCLLVGIALVCGCKSKGPVPGEGSPTGGPAPQVGAAETTGAHPGAANPHGNSGDPHAGLGLPPAGSTGQDPVLTDTGMLDIGAIAVKVPGAWRVEPPKSSMRKAQMVAEGDKGPAELVVFYFGEQGAGSAQENIERWVGQFTNADGTPVTDVDLKNLEINGHKVSRIEVAGRYANNMAMQGQEQPPRDDQRLIAAIVSTVSGPYYLKFLGPSATVIEQSAALDELLGSIVRAP